MLDNRQLMPMAGSAIDEGPLMTSKVARTVFYVVLFVIVLEALLHRLRHRLHANKKYLELLNKITTEFMVVGLIYLLVKGVIYAGWIPYGGLEYKALDAADLLLFFVAIALVVQSLAIIFALRRFNRDMDALELVTTAELVAQTKAAMAKCTWPITAMYHRKRLQMRLLGTFFRRTYGLPRLFCFAKYMRVLQEHQIVELLEIDFTTWVLLLGIFCGFFYSTGEMTALWTDSKNSNYYAVKDDDMKKITPAAYSKILALQNNRTVVLAALVAALFGFMLLFLLYVEHICTLLCVRGKVDILNGTDAPAVSDLQALDHLVASVRALEAAELDVSTHDAIAQMQHVGDDVEDNEDHHHRAHGNLLLQLLASGVRRCVGKRHAKANALSAKIDNVRLPLFSRKLCEFLIQFLLILNGMYLAMLLGSIVPTLQAAETPVVVLVAVLLAINMHVLAPRLIRSFALVNGIYRVEAHVLGNVISHFVEAESQRGKLVADVTAYCRKTRQTITDFRAALDAVDAKDAVASDGFVDIESLRRVLRKFGFSMSRHHFNAFVRIMDLRTKDVTVNLEDFFAIFPADDAMPQVDV
ncbi:Aste57867_17169 [Aphanomyces stellatus]|uniref:Aste57867_17169 protein n=1 Tax=Aphanomyces stellatus TaxID=120398 RepID=A0A485L8I1_9STRA|nr:hypothetical protein As57867_017110 [Aphanomyces stellatus]VFT93926.1 Aste57867_17169 [Aphanomyces stellatus]